MEPVIHTEGDLKDQLIAQRPMTMIISVLALASAVLWLGAWWLGSWWSAIVGPIALGWAIRLSASAGVTGLTDARTLPRTWIARVLAIVSTAIVCFWIHTAQIDPRAAVLFAGYATTEYLLLAKRGPNRVPAHAYLSCLFSGGAIGYSCAFLVMWLSGAI
jgi:hypothetical protein